MVLLPLLPPWMPCRADPGCPAEQTPSPRLGSRAVATRTPAATEQLARVSKNQFVGVRHQAGPLEEVGLKPGGGHTQPPAHRPQEQQQPGPWSSGLPCPRACPCPRPCHQSDRVRCPAWKPGATRNSRGRGLWGCFVPVSPAPACRVSSVQGHHEREGRQVGALGRSGTSQVGPWTGPRTPG